MSELRASISKPFLCSIIRSFEAIAEALVTKANFSNITIVSEDILLRGERVSVGINLIFLIMKFVDYERLFL